MNRRAFLKLFVGSVAVATIPIPRFLLPKKEKTLFVDNGTGFSRYGDTKSFNLEGGVLTQDTIESAALAAAANHGTPDVMYMEQEDYVHFAKYFGYSVTYKDDEIIHVRD
jgi:hypothetical protein